MQCTFPVIAVNGIIDAQISPLDRGFAYGDGVFETCKMVSSEIPFWNYHRERLLESCRRLSIPVNIELLNQQLDDVKKLLPADDLKNALVKITVTRGVGGRGYNPAGLIEPTYVIGIFAGSNYPQKNYDGISVRLCEQRLSCNSTLAGLKHLNRLEQILARAEWQGDNFSEGIVLDTKDNVIEGVFSNIFIVKDNKLITPDLSEAGVAGVMRRFILEKLASNIGVNVNVKSINLKDVIVADEIFLCNSNYGIWPVINFSADKIYNFNVGSITLKLQKELANALHTG